MTARRVRTLVILLVAALVATGIVGASAAQLTVGSATLLSIRKAPCTTATVAVTHGLISTTDQKTSSVVVTVPASCAGLPLALRLYKAGGVALHAADLTVASASAPTTTITLATVDRYAPSEVVGVAMTLGTWGVRTAWTSTAVTVPALSCAVVQGNPNSTCVATVTSATEWGYPTTTDFLRSITISSTSNSPVTWQLTINLSDPGFPFLAKALADGQGGLVLVSTSGCGASPRTVTVQGTTAWGGYEKVSSDTPRQLEVHGYASNQPSTMLLNCP